MLLTEEHSKLFIEDISYAKEFKTPISLFMSDGTCIGIGDDYSYAKIETNVCKKASTLRCIGLETKSFAKVIKGSLLEPLVIEDTPLYIKTPYGDIKKLPGVQELEFNVKSFVDSCLATPIVYQSELPQEFAERYKTLKADEGGIPCILDNKYYIILHKRILSYIASDKVYVNVRYIEGWQCFVCEFVVVTKKGFIFSEFIRGLMV